MVSRKRRRILTRERVRSWLESRFFLRIHMTLILGATFLAGLVLTNALLVAGIASPILRYALAVVGAYVAFLLLIRLWMVYVRVGGIDFTADGVQMAFDAGGSDADVELLTGGGRFGGAGASDSWGDAAPQAVTVSGKPSSGRGSWFSFDVDGEGLIVVILLIALVLALLLVGIYVIYSAPVILSEAFFEALLAGVLAKRARRIRGARWLGAVWRATAWPFLGVLALAIALGWAVRHTCPEAHRLMEVFECSSKPTPSGSLRDGG